MVKVVILNCVYLCVLGGDRLVHMSESVNGRHGIGITGGCEPPALAAGPEVECSGPEVECSGSAARTLNQSIPSSVPS